MATDNVHILIDKASDRGTYSGGSWRVTAPLVNLLTTDVREVCRSTDATTASTQFRIDGGTEPRRSWSMFALLGHTASTTAKWRVVCTDDAADAPGNRLYDSGEIAVWEPTVVFGSLPWGVFPWDGVDVNAYPNHPLAFHLAPAPTLARYVFVYIIDAGNAAGYIDLGRFLAGEAWSPATNVEYGFGIRWVDPSEVRRSEGGNRLLRSRPLYRVASMEFSWLTPTEAWGVIFEWQRLGKANDVLFVANPNDSPDIRFKRSFYGALVDTEPLVESFYQNLGCRVSIEELI